MTSEMFVVPETLRLEEPSPEEDYSPNSVETVTHVLTYCKY